MRGFLGVVLALSISASSSGQDADAIALPFVCSALLSLQAEGVSPSRRAFDFVPDGEPDRTLDNPSEEFYAAMEWVTGLVFQGRGATVLVKTGTPQEVARFFYKMAEVTDRKVFEAAPLRKRLFRRDPFDSGVVRPVPSPARQLQIHSQSYGGDIAHLKPAFITVELDRKQAPWEHRLVPSGMRIPREMGVLYIRSLVPDQVRVAFIFLDDLQPQPN